MLGWIKVVGWEEDDNFYEVDNHNIVQIRNNVL